MFKSLVCSASINGINAVTASSIVLKLPTPGTEIPPGSSGVGGVEVGSPGEP